MKKPFSRRDSDFYNLNLFMLNLTFTEKDTDNI